MPDYVPKDYWLREGATYMARFRHTKEFRLQESLLVDCLKNLRPPFSTVLELGCGFGRITKLLLFNFAINEYVAVDLSPEQIQNARGYVGDGKVEFIVSDLQGFESDKKYDLVIASEVLMHVLPSEIGQAVAKLASMSRHHVVNIDWYEEKPRAGAPHNFIHDYEAAYRNAHVASVERIPVAKRGMFGLDAKQSIFHATVTA